MYLRTNGASVTDTEDPDRAAFRADNGIPDEVASCHTALVGGYAVEGHVPAEAIRRLLDDRPALAGLSVPGMPSDSPGMGGDVSTWVTQDVVAVGRDGSLVPFVY